MKRFVSILLAGLLLLTMISCSQGGSQKETHREETTSVEETSKEETTSVKPTIQNNDTSDGIDADFKAAMDSYEEFFDEYVSILKKYSENPSDLSLLTDYSNYMSKYADIMTAFEAWENKDMNTAEAAYYIEVQGRITKKLLEVAY